MSDAKPSFPTAAEILLQVDTWTDLSSRRRADFKVVLNLLARIHRSTLESIRLDPVELSKTVLQASPASLGIQPSSLTGYQSSLRAILRRLDLIDMPRRQTTPLSPAWSVLRDALPDQFLSIRLQAFVAYCSDHGVAPEDVCDDTIQDYLTLLRTRRMNGQPSMIVAQVVKAWARAQREVPAWPRTELHRPALSKRFAAPLSAYPDSFQREVEAFEASLRRDNTASLYDDDAPPRQLSAATVKLRLSCIRYAAAALVAQGTPMTEITSLRDLVQLHRVKQIIDWHYRRADKKVTDHLATIADTLRVLAKYHVRLPEPELSSVINATRKGKPKKRGRMVKSREDRLQQLDDPDVEACLLHLPRRILADARELRDVGQHVEAAWLAGVAVAIAIELRCPMRMKNLASLRVGVEIIKLDSRSRTWTHILVDADDVKNGVPIQWPIARDLAEIIDVNLTEYRPALRNASTNFLFPNRDHADQPRVPATLSLAMTNAIHRFVGIKLNPHDFRAVAGWQRLKADPSAINDLRLILGHKTMDTTLAYYASFKPKEAAVRMNRLMDGKTADTAVRANIAFARSGGRRPRADRPNARGAA